MEFQGIIDTREQNPYRIPGAQVGTLKTGDYSIAGLEDKFAIERKSREDLWGSLTSGHERFRREMERAKEFLAFEIVLECSPQELLDTWQSGRKIHPQSLCGAIVNWRKKYGVQWVFWKTRKLAERYVNWRLWTWYREYEAGLWTPTAERKGVNSGKTD